MSVSDALNGHKMPLLINAAMFLPILGVMVAMWSDVQQLKADRIERGPVERIVRIEAQLEARTEDRYRSQDARRDFQLRDERMQAMQRQIDEIRRR